MKCKHCEKEFPVSQWGYNGLCVYGCCVRLECPECHKIQFITVKMETEGYA
jgi:hypothetical protein